VAAPDRYKGRHDSEEGLSDQRNRGARDRDRVLYTSATRRLAEVTQVVSSFEGHVFHNRLTHTLEVAQIARRLAEYLSEKQPLEAKKLGIDPEVVEAAALAHDIGHAPFGHLGEEVLNEVVEQRGDPDGFEANAQSFRIVTKLATRRDFDGLNLSRASLNALLKYPWLRDYDPAKKADNYLKFGAYRSEEEDFIFARKLYRATDRRKSAEAEIMDWADDVAYSVHDLDDFYRAGFIPLERLCSKPTPGDANGREKFIDDALDRAIGRRRPIKYSKTELLEALNRLLDHAPTAPPELWERYEGGRLQRRALRTFTSQLIRQFILEPGYPRGNFQEAPVRLRVPVNSTETRIERRPDRAIEVCTLQQLTSCFVFGANPLQVAQHGERRILKVLFRAFYKAARDERKGGLIPRYFQDILTDMLVAAPDERAKTRACARIAADIVAGMTERQAVELHLRLSGNELSSSLIPVVR
jgi:dGTPase